MRKPVASIAILNTSSVSHRQKQMQHPPSLMTRKASWRNQMNGSRSLAAASCSHVRLEVDAIRRISDHGIDATIGQRAQDVKGIAVVDGDAGLAEEGFGHGRWNRNR
jgi:hypothetical protein